MFAVCAACNARCARCLDASYTICSACTNNYYLLNTICLPEAECGIGKYGNRGNNQCASCDAICYTCSVQSSNCTACYTGYFLFESQCTSACPSRYYGDALQKKCFACSARCTACQDATSMSCSQCASGFYLLGSVCYDACPQGYFSNVNLNTCDPCSTNCKTCSASAANCTSCKTNWFFYQNACYSPCPAGTYPAGSVCAACHANCKECTNSTQFNCTACHADKILANKSCLLCPDFRGMATAVSNPISCVEICGDGIRVTQTHQCDDGNLLNGDGCSAACSIEADWVCKYGDAYHSDICIQNVPLNYTLVYLSNGTNFYNEYAQETLRFKLEFTQNVTLRAGADQSQFFKILVEGTDTNVGSQALQRVTVDVEHQNILYVDIQFTTSLLNRKLLFTINDQQLTDLHQNFIQESLNEKPFFIERYYYYSPAQRQQYQNTETLAKVLNLAGILIAAPAILTGNYYYVMGLVDLLQFVECYQYLDLR